MLGGNLTRQLTYGSYLTGYKQAGQSLNPPKLTFSPCSSNPTVADRIKQDYGTHQDTFPTARPLGFATTKLNFSSVPSNQSRAAAKRQADTPGGKQLRASSPSDNGSSLQLSLPWHGPFTERSYTNELNQEPAARPGTKNGAFGALVEVELSPQCRLQAGYSGYRELTSNYNANDLEAVDGVLNSDDYTDDPDALRDMQDRILQIRQKHAMNKQCLMENFTQLRRRAKDTAEYCGTVGQALRQNQDGDGLPPHEDRMQSFERKLDQIFTAQAETQKELQRATSGLQEGSLGGRGGQARQHGLAKAPSNHFLIDHTQKLRTSVDASGTTTL